MRKMRLVITADTMTPPVMLKIIDTQKAIKDLEKMAEDVEGIAKRDNNPRMRQKASGIRIAVLILRGYLPLKCRDCDASKNTRTRESISNIFCTDTNAWHGPTYCCAWHHTERRPTEGAYS